MPLSLLARMGLTAGLLLGAALNAQATAADTAPDRTPPDLILIMADDVGVEAFRTYGGESYATPRLDALATEGMRFRHCHSQPLCTPSRVKIMTGQSNIRNYVSFGILPQNSVTFANVLQDAGYATCVIGKWQLYGSRQELLGKGAGTTPAAAGFDSHCLWQVDRIGSRYGNPVLVRDGTYLEQDPTGYGPDRFVDHAIEFIARQRKAEKPYLLYFPMALVHSPYESPPGAAATPPGKAGRQARFAQMMTRMDELVGRIVDAVDEHGGRERTLVMFTSDNGTGRQIRSRQNGKVVQGGKGLSNDRGTHVPLIARWPGTVASGATCDALVDFSDFFVTLLAAAEVTPPGGLPLDGVSFWPQLNGARSETREWSFCYYNPRPERQKFARGRFARDHTHKLYGDGRLFDLTTDPEERSPLPADADDDRTRAQRQKLTAVIAAMPEHPVKIAPEHR